ncbi:MAG: response regulator [Cyclobacteriaceae bacterium]|nr:response regulator [Cyclobacteriaceae bacterium]
MNSHKPILLVEDDLVDSMTVKRALKELNVSNSVIHARNGEEAIQYLQGESNEKPCLILLDINMPKMNGIEFLRERKGDTHINIIPTIVLTTSNDDKDKFNSFSLNIAGYMVKPVDYRKFVEVMKAIKQYWSLSESPE